MDPEKQWIKYAAEEICGKDSKIYINGGLTLIGWPHSPKGWVNAEELATIIAAHAPQPRNNECRHCGGLMTWTGEEWEHVATDKLHAGVPAEPKFMESGSQPALDNLPADK